MRLLLNIALLIALIAIARSKKSGNSFGTEYKAICSYILNGFISFFKKDRSVEKKSESSDEAERFFKRLNLHIIHTFDCVKGWEPCAMNTMYLVRHNQPFQIRIHYQNGLKVMATVHVADGEILSIESEGFERKSPISTPEPEPVKPVDPNVPDPTGQQVQPATSASETKDDRAKDNGAAAFIAGNYIADNGIEIGNIATAAIAAGKSEFILAPGEDLPVLQLIADKLVSQLKFSASTVNDNGTITVKISLPDVEDDDAEDEFEMGEEFDSDEESPQNDTGEPDLPDSEMNPEIIDPVLPDGVTIIPDDDLPDPDLDLI